MPGDPKRGHLKRTQVTDIGRLAAARGLAAADFEWGAEEHLGGSWPQLRYRPTNSHFTFTEAMVGPGRAPVHRLEFSPGQERGYGQAVAKSWNEVLRVFDRWLMWVEEEREAPSFWEAFLDSEPEPEIESGEEPFTEGEVARLRLALDGARELLEDSAPSNALRDIQAEIEDLKRHVSKLERRAWWNLATGAFVNLTLRTLVPPEAATRALRLVSAVVRRVTQLPPAP